MVPEAANLKLPTLAALAYTLINSPGYYADRGDRAMLVLFAGIGVLAIPALVIRLAVG